MRLSPAQRDEITAIRDRNNGRVLPEEVVRFASDPATALHSAFTWDNARAARDHRLDQARRLIAVYVTVIRVQGRTIQVRPFFSNPQIRQQLGVRSGYADISMIRGNAQLELSIMADMLKQAYGADDKTLQSLREAVDHTVSELLNYRADLSYVPAK